MESLRTITTSQDIYGMDTDTLRDKLVEITGSEAKMNDVLAAFAEWLDTGKEAAHKMTKKSRREKYARYMPKKPKRSNRRSVVYRSSSFAAYYVELLAQILEMHVTDSDYVYIETPEGKYVRRRVLREISD